MTVTAARLAALAPRVAAPVAVQLAAQMTAGFPLFGVDSALAQAMFVAQACHETAGFTRFEENLRYTDPDHLDDVFSAVRGVADAAQLIERGPMAIANRVYARRNGNGDEASGDGWLFRGRGLFQLTGRANYALAATELARPYLEKPDLVAEPIGAVLTALWFWKKNGCNGPANRGEIATVTSIINGRALDGLNKRKALTNAAIEILK